MNRIGNWLWAKLEQNVQAALTYRILDLHDALIKRAQIPKPPEAIGPAVPSTVCYRWDCGRGLGPVPQQVEPPDSP